jgi:hypothetical protein
MDQKPAVSGGNEREGAPSTRATGADRAPSYTLGQLARYALKLGTIGFGGPVVLVGYMHRDFGGATQMDDRGRIQGKG